MTKADEQAPRVALAVSASVAIHRGLDLASELTKGGLCVDVLMTPAASRLIRPLLFSAITRRRVVVDLFSGAGDDPYDHLQAARSARVLVFAPATADLMARLAGGLANDAVTTCALAYRGPRILAPAMNWRMWSHAFTRRNTRILTDEGYQLVGPAEGDLACGEEGPGRLAPVADIHRAVLAALAGTDPKGGR